MTTGYILAAIVIAIGTTAFLRNSTKISYETFYLFHGLVAVLYIISIVHTFDRQ